MVNSFRDNNSIGDISGQDLLHHWKIFIKMLTVLYRDLTCGAIFFTAILLAVSLFLCYYNLAVRNSGGIDRIHGDKSKWISIILQIYL